MRVPHIIWQHNWHHRSVAQVKSSPGCSQDPAQAWAPAISASAAPAVPLLMCLQAIPAPLPFWQRRSWGSQLETWGLLHRHSILVSESNTLPGLLHYQLWKSGSQRAEVWGHLAFQRGSIIRKGILSLLAKSKRTVVSGLSRTAVWVARTLNVRYLGRTSYLSLPLGSVRTLKFLSRF